MANYPKRNSEGYYDPTAYEGVKSIVREENALDGRVSDLVRVLNSSSVAAALSLSAALKSKTSRPGGCSNE